MEPYRKKTEIEFLRLKVFEDLEEIKNLKEQLESREREHLKQKKKLAEAKNKELKLKMENRDLLAVLRSLGHSEEAVREKMMKLPHRWGILTPDNDNDNDLEVKESVQTAFTTA
ncbi:UNVERIFIED_CONTAM: hypothetical protein K2H54_051749 [Gekko kuhli]